MNKKIKMLADRVLVKVNPTSPVTKSGLILSPNTIDPPQTGEVMAVGVDVEVMIVGDTVLFPARRGAPVSIDDENFLIFNVGDIYAVI